MAHQIRKKVPLASKSEAGRNFAAQVLTSLSKADADDDRLFPGTDGASSDRSVGHPPTSGLVFPVSDPSHERPETVVSSET